MCTQKVMSVAIALGLTLASLSCRRNERKQVSLPTGYLKSYLGVELWQSTRSGIPAAGDFIPMTGTVSLAGDAKSRSPEGLSYRYKTSGLVILPLGESDRYEAFVPPGVRHVMVKIRKFREVDQSERISDEGDYTVELAGGNLRVIAAGEFSTKGSDPKEVDVLLPLTRYEARDGDTLKLVIKVKPSGNGVVIPVRVKKGS